MGGEELAKEVCNFEQTRLDARLYSFGEAERCHTDAGFAPIRPSDQGAFSLSPNPDCFPVDW